jgi:hypothetical protein
VTEEIDLETRLAAAITDPDFEKLELAMREPDIFRALAIERQEIRHSNFFAFLLDPGENHGLGDILLRKFLRDIFADSRAQGRTLFDADLMDFSQVDVRREWRGMDTREVRQLRHGSVRTCHDFDRGLACCACCRPAKSGCITFSRKTPQRLMRRFTRALVMSSEGHLDLNFASYPLQIGGAHMSLAREQPATSRLVRLRYA